MLTAIRSLLLVIIFLGLAACRSTLPPPSAPEPIRIPGQVVQTPLPVIPFTIQVGAFSTAERAADYARGLRAGGLDAYYFIDGDGLCKVRFESFPTKAEALGRALALQGNGVIDDYYVVQPGSAEGPKRRSAVLRRNIVRTARRFLGSPYRWGGESARKGFDCSGLTMTVYRLNGLQLPRNSRSQFDAGQAISQADLQIGDLVFYATGRRGRVSHVGIYSGGGKFIHAPGRGKRIRVASIHSRYFKARYMGSRRYL